MPNAVVVVFERITNKLMTRTITLTLSYHDESRGKWHYADGGSASGRNSLQFLVSAAYFSTTPSNHSREAHLPVEKKVVKTKIHSGQTVE